MSSQRMREHLIRVSLITSPLTVLYFSPSKKKVVCTTGAIRFKPRDRVRLGSENSIGSTR